MKLDTPERVLAWAEESEGCSHPDCGNSVCDEVLDQAEEIALGQRVLEIVKRDAKSDIRSMHILSEAKGNKA